MYLLVKDNRIVSNEDSLDAIKAVIVNRENFKIVKAEEFWRFSSNNKELPQSYSARIDEGGYTLEEVWKDLTAEKLARWFNYSVYQKL